VTIVKLYKLHEILQEKTKKNGKAQYETCTLILKYWTAYALRVVIK